MAPSSTDIWAAFAWGAVSSAGLLVGVVAGLFTRLSHHAIAMAMSVGAGLLLAAVSLKLATDAVRMAGPLAASAALLLGAAIFSAVNARFSRSSAQHTANVAVNAPPSPRSRGIPAAERPSHSAQRLTLCPKRWYLGWPSGRQCFL